MNRYKADFIFPTAYLLLALLAGCSMEPKFSSPEAKVYPKIVQIGDTVYCEITEYGIGVHGRGWSFVQKPFNSNSQIQNTGGNPAYFVADTLGIYIVRFGWIDEKDNEHKYKEFFVEVVNIRAFAGYDSTVAVGTVVNLDGSGSFGDQLTYLWTLIQSPPGANTQITNNTSVFASYLVDKPGDYLIQLKVTDVNQISDFDTVKITATSGSTGNPWTQITDYPGNGEIYCLAITEGSFGYVGLGTTDTYTDAFTDFWKFDPSGNGGSGSWIKLKDFPSDHTWDCTAFIINGKIYVGLGASTNPIPTSRKFYVYDPNTNTWDDGSMVPPFPGEPRIGTSSFVLSGEGYVGFGYKNEFPGFVYDDVYKYNPSSNSWDTLNTFPGGARYTQISFVLNGIAYMGYGTQVIFNSGYLDFWSYTPDSWTSLSPLQPLNSSDYYRSSMGAATNANGYLIGGASQSTDNGKQVWEFNPSNGWQRKTSAPEQFLNTNDAFSINNKIYCCSSNKHWYRYDPVLDQ